MVQGVGVDLYALLLLMILFSFSNVLSRLFELGVPTQQFVTSEPWIMKNVDEQNK
jgi:hypothetical protein